MKRRWTCCSTLLKHLEQMTNHITDYLKGLAGTEIAVIGMAFRFPGADTEQGFWGNLCRAHESSVTLSSAQLNDLGIPETQYEQPSYVRTVIEEPALKDLFDNQFFGYIPEEAAVMDPQTRTFHELAWEALESAGYAKAGSRPVTGIFAGGSGSFNHELLNHLSGLTDQIGFFNAMRLANKDYMCSRVAYSLNLTGPCYSINTTCSTSLAAVHLACRAIITGECRMALAGGASIDSGKSRGYAYEEGGVLSRDGHCRTFDADSTGTNFGQGAGIVVLKRLKEAVVDGDRIIAVIRGTAVNNDGNRKVGYTAPSIEGQKDVIRMAHKVARVNTASIRLMEAHGTGTPLGDPIEMEALRLAFGETKPNACAIGSVKSNFGHLDSAAGIAGLIKTILALKNKQLPPSLHFQTPNPDIDFANSPFYVNTELRAWEADGDQPRLAALSSFGIGGTNVHMVLEEAPVFAEEAGKEQPELLVFSAKTAMALQQSIRNFHEFAANTPAASLQDIAFTLQEGREAFAHRAFAVAPGLAEAAGMTAGPATDVQMGKAAPEKKTIIFMFPGQGSQYMGITGMLYAEDEAFRKEVDDCLALLPQTTAQEIKAIITWQPTEAKEKRKIISTRLTQPLLFIIQYSLSQLLLRLGLRPDAMIGHSLGEYVAACLSGVFSLPDALKIIVKRGELMQNSPEGAMLSVTATEEQVRSFAAKDISIAAVNGRTSCVVAGTAAAIEALEEQLAKENITSVRLHTDRAFHSTLIEGVLGEFEQLLQQVSFHPPVLPFISCLTGNFIEASEAMTPAYWVSHLRNTVRFYDGINALSALHNKLILEIGTARALSTYVRDSYKDKAGDTPVISLVRHPEQRMPEKEYLLKAIGSAWLCGCAINWKALHTQAKRVALPTYPFERKDFSVKQDLFELTGRLSLTGGSREKEDTGTTYTHGWKRMAAQPGGDAAGNVLILAGNDQEWIRPVFTALAERPGTRIARKEISRQEPAAEALLIQLKEAGFVPDTIITAMAEPVAASGALADDVYQQAFDQVLFITQLCRAFSAVFPGKPVVLKMINTNAAEIIGNDLLFPLHASVNALAGVIREEYPAVTACVIDIDHQELPGELLLRELLAPPGCPLLGIRRGYRWQPLPEPVLLSRDNEALPAARNILITGGLGGLGLATARFFATQTRSNCVLVSRTQLPPRESWEQWLAAASEADPLSGKIAAIRSIEAEGVTVLCYDADVADKAAMTNVISDAESRLGSIDAVIHAAGSPVRRVMERLSAAELASQWSAKVQGLQVLNDLFAAHTLQFFTSYSTINAFYPTQGQAGYATANAVLDAFAIRNDLQHCNHVKTISWSTWKTVGMAAEVLQPASVYLSGIQLITGHPLLRYSGTDKDGNSVFVSHLSPASDWVLHEHRVLAGTAVLPGTAYIELVNAAADRLYPGQAKELHHASFLAPMIFRDDEKKIVTAVFQQKGDSYRISITSAGSAHAAPQLHFTAELVSAGTTGINIPAWKDELSGIKEWIPDPAARSTEFGPRWNAIRSVQVKDNKAVAAFCLPASFRNDLPAFRLHPALLDLASAILYFHVKKDGHYLPAYYEKTVIAGHLTPEIRSYVQQRKSDTGSLVFDVCIADNEGKAVVSIQGLTYLPYQLPANGTGMPVNTQAVKNGVAKINQPEGYSTAENMTILAGTLASDHRQVLVKPVHGFPQRQTQQKEETVATTGAVKETIGSLSEVEAKLLAEWKKFFGSDSIGLQDDFFELGGDSVKVTIVLSRINKAFRTALSIADFFNHPTVSELATLVARAGHGGPLVIPPAEKKEYYALSAAQQRVHILELLHEGSTLYNITEAFELNGAFDLPRFEAVCRQLLQRHESLRTSVVLVHNRPWQKVHASVPLSVEYHEGQEKDITEQLYRFRRPFGMAHAPLARIGVFRLAAERHYVVIDLLHLIADGTSLLLIIRELMESYKGAVMAPLPRQYRDFAEWQARLVHTAAMEKQRGFWRQQLQGAVAPVHLPYDFAKTSSRNHAAGNHEFSFSPELSAQFRKMCQEQDCTAFMALTALFNTFFHRLSSQNDILIGIPHLGRVNEDFSNVVGMFINTVMLRNFPEPDKPFDRLLAEVKSNTLNVFENLDFQYEMILEMLRTESGINTENLITVFFNYRNMFVNSGQSGSDTTRLAMRSAGLKDNFAKFDLSIYAYDLEEGFAFTCNYAEGLFTADTIAYLMEQFAALAMLVAAEPGKTLGAYDVLTIASPQTADQADVFNF